MAIEHRTTDASPHQPEGPAPLNARTLPESLEIYLLEQQEKAAQLADLLRLLVEDDGAMAVRLAHRVASELNEALDLVNLGRVLNAESVRERNLDLVEQVARRLAANPAPSEDSAAGGAS